MDEEILIPISLFLTVFAVLYLYLSTRNKERLALIEKGADASIFMRGKSNATPIWKVLLLNFALLLMGIGVGTLLAMTIENMFNIIDEEQIYTGVIFLTAGASLFLGFNMTKNLDKE